MAGVRSQALRCPTERGHSINLHSAAWTNIHIVGVGKKELGALVAANYTDDEMIAQITFEILDASAKPLTPATGTFVIHPNRAALEKLREHRADPPFLENLGHGEFRLLDIATGIPYLKLKPDETAHFGLEYVPDEEARGYVVRATQFSLEGGIRQTVGGQTFVAGQVEGFTIPPEPDRGPLTCAALLEECRNRLLKRCSGWCSAWKGADGLALRRLAGRKGGQSTPAGSEET